ncbi:hypothetical protein ONS96_002832 [Cadophora gregata f. sp. sojae]|nr:hypothetical protein ONS96_002832 [Cadophora gregata f. sp. sojae]
MESPHRYGNGREISSRPPLRKGHIPEPTRGRRNIMVGSKQNIPPSLGGDGSAPPPAAQDQASRPLSRRRMSNKIGELYRAKSIEKKRKEDKETAQPRAETMPSLSQAKIALGLEGRIMEPGKPRPRKLSDKVANMRKLFDGKFSPRSASPEGPVPCCALNPISLEAASASSSRYKQEHILELRDLAVLKPPTPPPMPPSTQRKVSNVSLRNDGAPAVLSTTNASGVTKARKSQFSSPTKKRSPPKSKLIVEKVKIFESTSETFPEIGHSRRAKAFRRRLSKSLRGLFEAPSRKSQGQDQEQNKGEETSVRPNGDVSPEGSGLLSKRRTIVGRWNNVPTAVSSGGDGTTSEKHSPPPAEEDVIAEMVVKGVECGLKQPKPVRAVEMKRMALLCKDRMGEIMDRDKGRVSLRRKS